MLSSNFLLLFNCSLHATGSPAGRSNVSTCAISKSSSLFAEISPESLQKSSTFGTFDKTILSLSVLSLAAPPRRCAIIIGIIVIHSKFTSTLISAFTSGLASLAGLAEEKIFASKKVHPRRGQLSPSVPSASRQLDTVISSFFI